MSNLGWYQLMTTWAKKVGGPKQFMAMIFGAGAAAAASASAASAGTSAAGASAAAAASAGAAAAASAGSCANTRPDNNITIATLATAKKL